MPTGSFHTEGRPFTRCTNRRFAIEHRGDFAEYVRHQTGVSHQKHIFNTLFRLFTHVILLHFAPRPLLKFLVFTLRPIKSDSNVRVTT